MKNWGLLSIALFLLSGCFGNTNQQALSSNDLRAPVYQPYNAGASNNTSVNMPQSVTQPMNINPVPSNGTSNTQQNQPQQPLVQTIVIPQYTPQPAMLPYGQASYGIPQQIATTGQPTLPTIGQPYDATQQITIPAQNIIAPSTPVHQPASQAVYMQQPVQTAKQPTPVIPKPKIVQQQPVPKKTGEQVFPSWAAADYTAPTTPQQTDNVVYFKNPHRNETVQCSVVDVMCIASYQQQGYTQLDKKGTAVPVVVQPTTTPAASADEWDINSIPRW